MFWDAVIVVVCSVGISFLQPRCGMRRSSTRSLKPSKAAQDLSSLTIEQLRDLLRKKKSIYENSALRAGLPDKGARIVRSQIVLLIYIWKTSMGGVSD